MTERYAHVALPLPLATPYTYRIPETLADRAAPGARAVVPVRARELVGLITALHVDAPRVAAKDVLALPDHQPALSAPLLETARWMASYYGAPIGLALKAMLPSAMWGASRVVARIIDRGVAPGGLGAQILDWLADRGGEAPVAAIARWHRHPVWDALDRLARVGAVSLVVEPPETGAGEATERILELSGDPLPLLERDRLFKRSPKQRALYEAIEQRGGTAALREIRGQLELTDAVIRGLVGRGVARLADVERVRDPFAAMAGSPPIGDLTPAQSDAVAAIDRLEPGLGALLFGVTGSGKTRVYLEAIRHALDRGRGAIILVPEIGLTPQTVGRVRGMFGDQVAVLHSGLSDGERADAWRLLRRGERRVAVGARSAIFAPVVDLGVIVVDEEHETSYKNGEAPRYHAVAVAGVRARLEGARVVLGSATPSLETMGRARSGRLTMIRLPQRIGAMPLPDVELVDLRSAGRVEGAGAIPWSLRLDELVTAALARREQVLLLLNRRGYASFLQCPSCGAVSSCPRCSIALTVHQHPPSLRCHYCDHSEPVPSRCAQCGHAVQRMRGIGTQQLEQMLGERFPAARLCRMDLDTTSTKWSHHRIFGLVERGEVDILFGTQMIAKGLDFPNVTLVGVVDADTGIYLPDFRSAERTFQLIAQVAGRAGRGPKGGRVVVQTRNPAHHALVRAAAHDTEGFVAEELALRQSPPYPPVTSLVNLLVSGTGEALVVEAAMGVAEWAAALQERHALAIEILGPAPCPVVRIKDRWRWHVVLKGPGKVLGQVVRYAARRLPAVSGIRVAVDRDPVSLL